MRLSPLILTSGSCRLKRRGEPIHKKENAQARTEERAQSERNRREEKEKERRSWLQGEERTPERRRKNEEEQNEAVVDYVRHVMRIHASNEYIY